MVYFQYLMDVTEISKVFRLLDIIAAKRADQDEIPHIGAYHPGSTQTLISVDYTSLHKMDKENVDANVIVVK